MNFTQVVCRVFWNFNWTEFLSVKTISAFVVFVEIIMIKETLKILLGATSLTILLKIKRQLIHISYLKRITYKSFRKTNK